MTTATAWLRILNGDTLAATVLPFEMQRFRGFTLWWWRRMVASMVGVDGGLGSSTQRGTDVEVSLCLQQRR